jgi:hypothetical protein
MRYAILISVFLSCLLLTISSAFGTDAGYPEDDSLPFPVKKSSAVFESSSASSSAKRVSIAPMAGGTYFSCPYSLSVENQYSTGAVLEVPLTKMFSTELEGAFGQNRIRYGYNDHGINQYGAGADVKMYLFHLDTFRPYVGGGLMALNYDGLQMNGYQSAGYNQWVGAGQVIAGTEVGLSEGVALGVRGSWTLPVINRPVFATDAIGSPVAGYEEFAAVNSQYFRVMGALKMSF